MNTEEQHRRIREHYRLKRDLETPQKDEEGIVRMPGDVLDTILQQRRLQ